MYGGKVSMKLLDFFAFLPNKSDGTKFVMMSPAGCGYGGEYLADMDTCWTPAPPSPCDPRDHRAGSQLKITNVTLVTLISILCPLKSVLCRLTSNL